MSENLPDKVPNKSGILFYQAEDGRSQIHVRLEDNTVWLSQMQMAELFQTSKQNISLHINNIFEEKVYKAMGLTPDAQKETLL